MPKKLQTLTLTLALASSLLCAEIPSWANNPDREITINMVPGNMKFDTELMRVQPGEKVVINF